MASRPRRGRCGARPGQDRGGRHSEFVKQCRNEWERLGVANSLAEEMASDLTTDLQEAELEGISAEEFLGQQRFRPASLRRLLGLRARDHPPRRRTSPPPPAPCCSRRVHRHLRDHAALRSRAARDRRAKGVTRHVQSDTTSLPRSDRRHSCHLRVESRRAQPNRSSGFSCASRSSRSASAAWLWSRWGRSRVPIATSQ